MHLNPSTIACTAILWLGSLLGAYHLGNRPETDGKSVSSPDSTDMAESSRTHAASHSDSYARRSRPRDAADKPPTVKQILARVSASIRGGSMQNPAAMMKVMGMLDKIRPEEAQQALAEAEAITDPQARGMVVMCLLAKWAEADGPAAMEYAEKLATDLGPVAQVGMMSVAGAWAERDPEAVWDWYQKLGDRDSGGMASGKLVLSQIFASMAESDLDLAFKRLEEIDNPGKPMALMGMFHSTLFDDDKRLRIMGKIDALPDEEERRQARDMMLGQWAMLAPGQAAEWVRAQPQAEQRELRETMGSILMMSEPTMGAKLMMEGVSEEEAPKAYSQVVSRWAGVDANAAGNWLREQPQGPQLDEARKSFVAATCRKDPEKAMAWAATIIQPGLRYEATKTAYQTWKKQDPAAADQALATSGLDEAEIQALKNGTPQHGAAY